MNNMRFQRGLRNWQSYACIPVLLALWIGAAQALPGNPKDPPLPPSTMGELYGDSSALVRSYIAGPACSVGMVGQLRLQDGVTLNEGRVEICVDVPADNAGPVWGTVCDDYWTDVESGVACRQLGYVREESPSGRFRNSFFGAGTGPIVLDDMQCDGNESGLLECKNANGDTALNVIGVHNCRATETVGVRCLNTTGDTSLRELYVNDPFTGQQLSFLPGTTNFVNFGAVLMSPGLSQITLYAVPNDSNATVQYLDNSSNVMGSGASMLVQNIPIGWSSIVVRVTADDGTVQDSTVAFHRPV